jgi:Ca-activated chloride channel homolog
MDGTVEIKGMIGEQPWVAKIALAQAAEGTGLSKVWARAKIDDAEIGVRLGKLTLDDADKRILQLALEHSLLSRLTSLVAVDKTPSRPENAPLARADVPLNLPAGWEFDKVFGEHPRGEAPVNAAPGNQEATPELIDAAYKQAVAASHQPLSATTRVAQSKAGVPLPQTATSATAYLLGGALLLLLGLPVLVALRRREAGHGE